MNSFQVRMIFAIIAIWSVFRILSFWLPMMNEITANAQTRRAKIANNTPVAGAPELAEMTEKHGYRLEPGQAIQRIVPPFPGARTTYYNVGHPDQANAIKTPPDAMIFFWDGKQPKQWGMRFGAGYSVQGIAEIALKTNNPAVEGPADLLERTLAGDWVISLDAPEEQALQQLETILVKQCDLPVRLYFAKRVRPVYVASGKFDGKLLETAAAPKDPVPFHRINVYEKTMTVGAGGGSGDFKQMLEKVGAWINTTLVDEVVEPPESLKFNWQFFQGEQFQNADQRSADEVLQKIAEQTGLTFKKELRPVRRLIIEPVEPDAKPDPQPE